MADNGFDDEEWDADFLDKLVEAEELALSTQLSRHPPQFQPPPQAAPRTEPPTSAWKPPSPPWRPQPPPELSYSPPRELSQRTHETYHTGGVPEFVDTFAPHGTGIAKESELSKLQKELNRVSKQLSHMEKDCSELRKERDHNLEQLKELNSRIKAKDVEVKLTPKMEIPSASGISATFQNAKPSNKQPESWTKSCDTERNKATEVSTSTLQETCCRSEKLFGLWNSNGQKQGRVIVADLYKICEADFNALFNCMNSLGNDSNMTSSHQQCSLQPEEFAKVLHVYSVFTKISNDILRLEDLLEALAELCNSKNVFIVHWSLRVLHKVLSKSSRLEKKFDKRENVTVEEPISGDINANGRGNMEKENLCFVNVTEMLKQGQIPSLLKFSNAKTPDFSGFSNHNSVTSASGVYLVSLFERMCQITTEINDEQVRYEALSIMNLILMRHNAYLERDKFAGKLVFRSLSQLLRKEAGFSVQEQAVHVLYLLCNCPKVIAMISSCLQEDGEVVCSKDMNANSFPTLQVQELNAILIGLADCVAFYGSATAEEMKLRRNAMTFLAFLGSSGTSGFNILLYHKLPKNTNFLAIILQSILSDLDLQASKSVEGSSIVIVMEQNLVVREALILLNRLVSHPHYSIHALKALTGTRASMTVDFANRLTQKSKLVWQDDNTKKQIRESEILELAHVFKRRVFTYLGDSIS